MILGAFEAGFWGLVSGSALVFGALVGYFVSLPQRLIAAIMAFGSGVLISALSFELMEEAFRTGGFAATAVGFLSGALVYTIANVSVSRKGGQHRKRSGHRQPQSSDGGGTAIAIGALLDGVPEAVVIGASLLGGKVSLVAVAAVFLSNVPEGLSSAAGMRRAGRSVLYIFGIWGGIALASGLAAMAGYALLADAGPAWTAAVNAVAAGAILAMIADTMIPEAFEETRDFAGFITVLGFLAAFALSRLGG